MSTAKKTIAYMLALGQNIFQGSLTT